MAPTGWLRVHYMLYQQKNTCILPRECHVDSSLSGKEICIANESMRLGRSKPWSYMLQGCVTSKPSKGEQVHTKGEGEEGKVWR